MLSFKGWKLIGVDLVWARGLAPHCAALLDPYDHIVNAAVFDLVARLSHILQNSRLPGFQAFARSIKYCIILNGTSGVRMLTFETWRSIGLDTTSKILPETITNLTFRLGISWISVQDQTRLP